MENYAISVDWLEVHGHLQHASLRASQKKVTFSHNFKTYSVELQDVGTSFFNSRYIIKEGTYEIASLTCCPRSKKVHPSICHLKLANRLLYCEGYINTLYMLLEKLKIEYKGISRLDVCYDCNRFFNGYKPSRFIKDFISKDTGEMGYIHKKGSPEFYVRGSKQWGTATRVNYLAFSSRNSRVRSYIYDKTKELKEEKDKPWIREMWEKNGLISDDKTHVYRCEISIKSGGQDMLNLDTGELFRLDPSHIKAQKKIEMLFYSYAQKYFSFSRYEGQKHVKNFTPITLFENVPDRLTIKPKRMSKAADTGRMEKVCYNKIEKLATTYVDISESLKIHLDATLQFLDMLRVGKSQMYERYKNIDELVHMGGEKFYREVYGKHGADIYRKILYTLRRWKGIEDS